MAIFYWKHLRHRQFVPAGGFWLKSGDTLTSESEFFSVLFKFLMVGMESTPSKTSRMPKIIMFDNCILDFKMFFLDSVNIVPENPNFSGPNR